MQDALSTKGTFKGQAFGKHTGPGPSTWRRTRKPPATGRHVLGSAAREMTLKRTRAPGGQHGRAAGKARGALPNITPPAAVARLRHPRFACTRKRQTPPARKGQQMRREGEHRLAEPPPPPRGRAEGRPFSRGEAQVAGRSFFGEGRSGRSGAQPGGRPPAAATMPGKAPQGRGALAKEHLVEYKTTSSRQREVNTRNKPLHHLWSNECPV
ncbi:dermatopontin isoform X2 [Excalfactoria chinensis]|uniref:dermatopontin isoform X2 n=1 Tax=Excalfactoria chinensis TaxID=46218 RepID=UPI003B3ACBE0